jgi:hypothetical protein
MALQTHQRRQAGMVSLWVQICQTVTKMKEMLQLPRSTCTRPLKRSAQWVSNPGHPHRRKPKIPTNEQLNCRWQCRSVSFYEPCELTVKRVQKSVLKRNSAVPWRNIVTTVSLKCPLPHIKTGNEMDSFIGRVTATETHHGTTVLPHSHSARILKTKFFSEPTNFNIIPMHALVLDVISFHDVSEPQFWLHFLFL